MKKRKFKQSIFLGGTTSELIYMNDIISLTYLPSKSCYAGKISDDISTRLKYIGTRVREHHESVIEHAYLSMIVRLPINKASDLIDIMNGFRYLNVETTTMKNYINILIGGSIRGYKHLIRETVFQTNPIITAIKECLYYNTYSEFFIDLIEMGVMSDRFIDPIEEDITNPFILPEHFSKYVEILNIDPIQTIYEAVRKYGFSMEQCLSMSSITILFKDMSRIITQQLVRHRNAVTQESQRYVNYSDVKFNSPADFKNEKYDKNKDYEINIFDTNIISNLQDLGDELCKVYKQLVEQGLDREDARGYLPLNDQSSKVYMTFTYRSLIQFINLRTESHAQAEIRMYATIIKWAFIQYIQKNICDNYEDFLTILPRCMLTESEEYNNSIDESIEENITPDVIEESDTIDPDFEDNKALFRAELKNYSPSTYADTRDESDIKTAKSGKRDV